MTVRILSAEHGLISADTPIAWYDRRMTRERATELYLRVQHEINEALPLPAHVFVGVGATYRLALLPMPERRIVWASGGIGERLGQLRAWLWGLELNLKEYQDAAD